MPLISCNDAAFAYDNGIVLEDVNFSVDAGDYLCIVGENGSGKTTLMKGLLGLIHPAAGKVVFGDGLRPTEVGYLPQQTAVQKDFPASVYEVVLSGRLNSLGMKPFYAREDKEKTNDAIRLFGMEDQAQQCYRELSSGQQQRVLLARALCATKKLLLLDEPVAGLDPKATADLYKIIGELNRNQNIAVIMISHDVDSAVKYARHILHLDQKQLFMGTVADYIASPAGEKFMGGASC